MKGKITVHPYRPELKQEWDDFVEQSNNGTMFHLQRFLDYHPSGKWDFDHLMFREGDRLVGVVPGGRNAKNEFWSPLGASYGGIVTMDTSFERCLRIVDACLEHLQKEGYSDAYLIPPPLIYSRNYSQHVEYAQLYRKADFELHYISHAIDLKRGADFLSGFDATARKTTRKILREKEIEIKESTDYATFHRILTENKLRHGVRATHSLEDLLRLHELMPDKLRLNLVYHRGEPIAGSLLFLTNSKVVLCFYNMLLYEYEHLKPIYLVMYETCRWAVEQGYEWVDIGVSQDTKSADPMTPSLGLIEFKERFDARGILRSTFHHAL
ncbi:MAG: GNAT family N-acetyltransferase [Bradyrhizobiaceae bacterium]|nr:GNAT family N-acetyltransferase [Bradyrhizobiaceae bacterium]